jgi:hypothetical protein
MAEAAKARIIAGKCMMFGWLMSWIGRLDD